MRQLWRHPALLALGAALLIVVAAFLPAAWQALTHPPGGARPVARDAPWEADVTADGALRAFGLRVPGATLADARALWGDDLQIALMASQGRAAVLEASVENARPGGVSGRLVFSTQAAAALLASWRDRATKDAAVSAETRRLELHPDDLEAALRSPISAIGFIPSAQLDATVLRHRFGEPQEIIGEGAQIEHWLYPARGLAVALDAKGRELLQYVPPAEFESRLRAPLRKAAQAG